MPKTSNEKTPYAEQSEEKVLQPWVAIHYDPSALDATKGYLRLAATGQGPKFTKFLEGWRRLDCDYAERSSLAGEAMLADLEEGHSPPASILLTGKKSFLNTNRNFDFFKHVKVSSSLGSRRGQGNGPWDIQAKVEFLDHD